jgi:predicted small lipoprotein YifL
MKSPSNFITSSSRAALLAIALFAIAACGKKGPLEGTYASSDATYEFKGDTVKVTRNGSKGSSQMKYAVDGKKVTYTAGKYKYKGVISDDGSVTMDNDKLVKK